MLAVVFHAGGESYALPIDQVREVLPRVHLRRIPGAPEYVMGVFSYRGVAAPALDLSVLLAGRPSAEALGTRLLVVDVPTSGGPRPLAIAAERVTQTVEIDRAQLSDAGLVGVEPPYLGEIAAGLERMLQLIKPAELLPAEWRDRLLVADEGAAP